MVMRQNCYYIYVCVCHTECMHIYHIESVIRLARTLSVEVKKNLAIEMANRIKTIRFFHFVSVFFSYIRSIASSISDERHAQFVLQTHTTNSHARARVIHQSPYIIWLMACCFGYKHNLFICLSFSVSVLLRVPYDDNPLGPPRVLYVCYTISVLCSTIERWAWTK